MKIKVGGIILSLALMFFFCLGFIPGLETAMVVNAANDSGYCQSCWNIAWKLDGDTLIIFKAEDATTGDMCWACQAYINQNVEKVIISPGVTSIGSCLFDSHKYVKEVEIPDTVTRIDDWAFRRCPLIKLTIPNSVTSIDEIAFADCYNLEEATVPCRLEQQIYQNRCLTGTKLIFNHPIEFYTIDESTNTLIGVCACGEERSSVSLSEAPAKPNKITNVVSGVHVYWPAVSGVSKYGLWRSETGVNGTYKWIANPTVAHFTDTKVESGKTYYYKVTLLNTDANIHSAKSAAIGITYVATPDITLRVNRAVGVGLGWEKIAGATGYAIYRKPYSGNSDWVRVATITNPNTLTWNDTSVKADNGSVYKYTIRALAGSDSKTLSGCRATGRTMVRLTSRTLNSATKASATSIKCNWSTTTQATGYEVRFMVGNTVYKTYTIGNYKTGTKTFTGLKAGQTYKIQVRTYKKVDGVGSFYSAWSTAKTVSL